MATQSGGGAHPAPKRTLFKKSAYAKPLDDDEGLSLFSRSKEIFPDVVAESERQRKNLERNRSNATVEQTDHSALDGKRRRTSNESEDSGDHSSDNDPARNNLKGRRTPHSPKQESQSAGLAATSQKRNGSLSSTSKSYKDSSDQRASRKSKTPPARIISLSDSEDDTAVTRNRDPTYQQNNLEANDDIEIEILKPPKMVIPPVQEIPEEEDEFAEYVAKARREGARQKFSERLDSGKSQAHLDSMSSNGSTAKSGTSNAAIPVNVSPPAPDPIVHILVSSVIQGTRPLILKRKLSQRLKDVRVAWCDKQVVDGQPVSEETKRQIFLTWRKKRVWDLTTCKSMGLKVDPHGKLRSNGEGVNEEGQVHLEAWTEEIYGEYMKQQASERKRRALDPMDEEEEEELENEELNPKIEVQKLRIMLKSKKYEDFKLMVSASTLVSKLIGAFKSQNKIAPETEISLYLDGDKLEPESTVGDADVEEMTTIDVHTS